MSKSLLDKKRKQILAEFPPKIWMINRSGRKLKLNRQKVFPALTEASEREFKDTKIRMVEAIPKEFRNKVMVEERKTKYWLALYTSKNYEAIVKKDLLKVKVGTQTEKNILTELEEFRAIIEEVEEFDTKFVMGQKQTTFRYKSFEKEFKQMLSNLKKEQDLVIDGFTTAKNPKNKKIIKMLQQSVSFKIGVTKSMWKINLETLLRELNKL